MNTDAPAQLDGILIRFTLSEKTLTLVLIDLSDDYPFRLPHDATEIVMLHDSIAENITEGLNKSVGEHLWVACSAGLATIGSDWMADCVIPIIHFESGQRQCDRDDLIAMCSILRDLVIIHRDNEDGMSRRLNDLQIRIRHLIDHRKHRLEAKKAYFSDKDPVKEARFAGQLELLSDLDAEMNK